MLAGGGPDDVVELTLALAREMLDAAGVDGVDPAQTLRDGTAMDRFRALVAAQGGDVDDAVRRRFTDRCAHPRPSQRRAVARWATSTRWRWDWRCGGSERAAPAPGEQVQFGAGMRIHRRPGEPVAAGEPLFTLYTDTPERFGPAHGRTGRRLERRRPTRRPSAR